MAWRLIDFHHIKTIVTTSKRETAILLTTFFARSRRARGGGGLYLVKIKEEACGTLRKGGFRDLIGPENIFLTKADAIETIFQRLDHDVCAHCDKRIFLECARTPYASRRPARRGHGARTGQHQRLAGRGPRLSYYFRKNDKPRASPAPFRA